MMLNVGKFVSEETQKMISDHTHANSKEERILGTIIDN